jgi:hypothetical protein
MWQSEGFLIPMMTPFPTTKTQGQKTQNPESAPQQASATYYQQY